MSRGTRSSVQDLKASFESRSSSALDSASPQPPQPRAQAGGLTTNMSAPKRIASLSKTPRNSIDAVLDTTPAKTLAPASPPPLSRFPSWIGPKPAERAITPGGTIMKLPVAVEFESPGLQPPVFIASSLTDPLWSPVEMDSTLKDNGEHHFKASFQAEEGEYQYKLRLGPGDWWVCDSTKPTVDDGAGNKNNLLIVKADMKPASDTTTVSTLPQQAPQPGVPVQPSTPAAVPAPTPPVAKDFAPPATSAPAFDSHPPHAADEPPHAPLLPHELAPPSEQHAPLLPHETTPPDHKAPGPSSPIGPMSSTGLISPSSPIIPAPIVPAEADPNDPTLIRFPTDHAGIMQHLESAQNRKPDLSVSSPRSGGPSAMDQATPPLPTVRENEMSGALPSPDPEYEAYKSRTLPVPEADYEDAPSIDRPGDLPEEPLKELPTKPTQRPGLGRRDSKEREFEEKTEAVLEVLTAEAVELAVATAVVQAEAEAGARALDEAEREERREERKAQKKARRAEQGTCTLALGFIATVAIVAIGVWLSGGGEGVHE